MKTKKLWTRDFILATVINLLLTLVLYSLMVIIAPYASAKFNASSSVAGLAAGISIIGISLGRLMTGHIIGRTGSKRVLFLGSLLFIITSSLYFLAVNLPLLIINRLLQGFTQGIASTATGTIVAQVIPPDRRGEGIGYFSLSAILATALGPFIGILLSQHADYNSIFVFDLALAVTGLILSFIIKEPVIKLSEKKQRKADEKFILSEYFEPKAITIAAIAFIISFCYSGVLSFMAVYSRELNLVKTASVFFIVYAVTVLLTRPFSGRILDLKGANIVVYPCFVIFAAGMLILSRSTTAVTLLVSAVFIGIGYGNFQSTAQALSIKNVPGERLGLATSTYFVFYDMGLGIGPYILGYIIPLLGYRGLYLMMDLVIIAALILYHFLYGKKVSVD